MRQKGTIIDMKSFVLFALFLLFRWVFSLSKTFQRAKIYLVRLPDPQCTIDLSIALTNFQITKSKTRSLINFVKALQIYWSVETAQRFRGGGDLRQKCGTYGRKTWMAWLIKLKFCTHAKQILLFEKNKSKFFVSGPIHGATISQLFLLTRRITKHSTRPKYTKHILPPAC